MISRVTAGALALLFMTTASRAAEEPTTSPVATPARPTTELLSRGVRPLGGPTQTCNGTVNPFNPEPVLCQDTQTWGDGSFETWTSTPTSQTIVQECQMENAGYCDIAGTRTLLGWLREGLNIPENYANTEGELWCMNENQQEGEAAVGVDLTIPQGTLGNVTIGATVQAQYVGHDAALAECPLGAETAFGRLTLYALDRNASNAEVGSNAVTLFSLNQYCSQADVETPGIATSVSSDVSHITQTYTLSAQIQNAVIGHTYNIVLLAEDGTDSVINANTELVHAYVTQISAQWAVEGGL